MDERGAYQKSILLSWRNDLPKKGIICVLLCEKGSRMAVSDVGVGVQLIRAALLGAVMNVYINTKSMKDRE